jgi:hypothetical protein
MLIVNILLVFLLQLILIFLILEGKCTYLVDYSNLLNVKLKSKIAYALSIINEKKDLVIAEVKISSPEDKKINSLISHLL